MEFRPTSLVYGTVAVTCLGYRDCFCSGGCPPRVKVRRSSGASPRGFGMTHFKTGNQLPQKIEY